jgi:hypothetical protein
VDFIDDVDLESSLGREVLDLLPEVPDFVNAPIGSAVDFQDVQERAGGDFPSNLAGVAGMGGGAAG